MIANQVLACTSPSRGCSEGRGPNLGLGQALGAAPGGRGFESLRARSISFWDALILAAAAEEAGAYQLYSEDLNTGQTIAGVKIVNPLMIE
jgi:hypothetical protein